MTVQPAESKPKGLFSKYLSGSKAIWAAALAAALFAVGGAMSILGAAAATETYYVLNRDVAARTQVTPEMLEPREAKVGQAPPTAFDVADVQSGEVFTQIALSIGDVVTTTNAGPLTRITADVPDNFVAASFNADPEMAVAGKVRTGDFVDIIAVNPDGTNGTVAKVIMQHVLVLDVTVNPSNIAEEATAGQEGADAGTPGPESEAVRSGIPSVYTVAVNPNDAAKLALARSYDLFVVLAGNIPDSVSDVTVNSNSVFGDTVNDSSAGTFGSIFIKRWDVAFEVGNVFVDDSGTVWKVNADKKWAEAGSKSTLDAGDVPPGYLDLPVGIEFTDADGTYWVAAPEGETDSAPVVWTDPVNKTSLGAGDNPDGYNPHAEFSTSTASE